MVLFFLHLHTLQYILNLTYIGGVKMRSHKEYEDLDAAIDLVIHTKSPNKWLLIDRETGEVYQGNAKGFWDRLDPVIKETK